MPIFLINYNVVVSPLKKLLVWDFLLNDDALREIFKYPL